MSFGNENRSALNKGTYGTPLPPNTATRLAPPKWVNYRAFLTAGTFTSPFVVPQNVYQIMVCVWGAGGSGSSGSVYNSNYALGGSGGGYAQGIIDVVPGQILSTITVGAGGASVINASGNAGGTSSYGTLLSATGGTGGVNNSTSAGTGGSGTASTSLRQYYTATGGVGGYHSSNYSYTQGSGGGGAGRGRAQPHRGGRGALVAYRPPDPADPPYP